jgi:glycosyltransferase involved in cell wall biosynthesis
MRILFICKVSPLQEYGTEIRAREIARRLTASGHEITVICARVSVEEPAEQRWNDVRILVRDVLPRALLRRFPYPHYVPQAASSALLILHVLTHLRRERYDLVRDDMSPFPSSGLGAFLSWPGTQRSVVIQHYPTTFAEARRNYGLAFGLAAFFMASCFRRGWLRYDRVLAVNPYHVEIAGRNPRLRARTRFSPNGVDTDQFSASVGAGDPWRMLSVGRLVPLKGHRYLIDALGALAPRWPQLRLTLLGDGPLRSDLLAQARALGVGDRLTILPGVAHAQMPALYAAHGLFVLPSMVEGFSLALLEAMASGLPAVISDIPAHTSVLDERVAAFFACASATSLEAVLTRVLEDAPAMLALAERGRAFARQFDWAAIARQESENV